MGAKEKVWVQGRLETMVKCSLQTATSTALGNTLRVVCPCSGDSGPTRGTYSDHSAVFPFGLHRQAEL